MNVKPSKPKEPKPPEPMRTINHREPIWPMKVSELITLLEQKGLPFDCVTIDDDGGPVLHWKTVEPNTNYKAEYAQYEKALERHNKAMADYKVKLVKYKESTRAATLRMKKSLESRLARINKELES